MKQPTPEHETRRRKDCETCAYFQHEKDTPFGECRRHAPKLEGFPRAFEYWWCGEWQDSRTTSR